MVRLKSNVVSKPQACPASKLSRHQRSDGDCALSPGLTNRFGNMIEPDTSRGLTDSRRYRGGGARLLLMLTRMGSRRTRPNDR
jgi:hypothetical protein